MVGSVLLYPDMERPSLYFLKFFCSVLFDTTSRTVGRLNEPAPGSAHRESNPSEDLSELPPLRSVVAGQEYHCPRTRSLRGSLPKLLLDGWVPLVTFLGRLYTENLYRWSSRIHQIAFPRRVLPTDVLLNRI